MTLEQFQKEYTKYVAPFDHELELIVSEDGCMLAKYDEEYIPHLANSDWSKVLDGVIAWVKETPEYRENYWKRWLAAQFDVAGSLPADTVGV